MPDTSRPTTDERDNRAEQDWRDNDHRVLTRQQGAANYGYAYHEPNEDGEPACNAGGPEAKFIEVTVAEAQRRNKSPCKMCNRILQQ